MHLKVSKDLKCPKVFQKQSIISISLIISVCYFDSLDSFNSEELKILRLTCLWGLRSGPAAVRRQLVIALVECQLWRPAAEDVNPKRVLAKIAIFNDF